MMQWRDVFLLVFAILAGIFVITTLEKCDLQHECLQVGYGKDGQMRSAKDCGL